MNAYREILTNRTVLNMLLLGLLVRICVNSQFLLLILHVRDTLDYSYGDAGELSAVIFLCIACSALHRGPWIDRFGLRRTIGPSILVNAVCWTIAPFSPFSLLLFLGALSGWFDIPVMNIVRQAIVTATTERGRRVGLSADSLMVDVSYLLGPPLCVAAANIWGTTAVIFVIRLVVLGCGVALWLQNPPVRTDPHQVPRPVPRRRWLRPDFLAPCLAYAAAVAFLSAEELSVISVINNSAADGQLGLILAIGSAGGVVGGYAYGAISTAVSPYLLLLYLGIGVLSCVLLSDPFSLAVAIFVVGTLAGLIFPACTDRMNAVTFEEARGEAIGFNFATMWFGQALGNLMVSEAVDIGGSTGGFLFSAAIGIGSGIVLGWIAARAAPTRGSPDYIGRIPIVATTWRMLDML
ncbi:MFS transporter, partial [Nocardia sp. NPDC049190]|uniref:MFS transporter n=1 Tax=Nocardia sp. NPDC049190 TaxID=3155650 RepID=UPI0033F5D3FC